MKTAILGFALFAMSVTAALASSVPACMVHAKTLQNPSALAGAAEVCMAVYFEELSVAAEECRVEAAVKPLAGAEFAACQATLILGLRKQIEMCRTEANSLSGENSNLIADVAGGAESGCSTLSRQATQLCRDNARTFSGVAEAAAETACEAAGL